MKILYTSKAIREAIRDLFAKKHSKRRRVACVAFIGADCMDFIPFADGLQVYCWPQPGGTNSDGLNRLLSAGAKLRFADGLHSKVYWTDGVGCVVTSANLSRNALGDGGLAETGVFFPDSASVDIDQVIAQKKSRAATNTEILELARKNARLRAKLSRGGSGDSVTFGEWSGHPAKVPWKLAWVTDEMATPTSVEDHWKQNGGSEEDGSDWAHCRAGEYQKDDWLLVYDPYRVGEPYWMFVTDVIAKKKGEEDQEEYPYSAIQVGSRPMCAPFTLQKPFPRALFEAVKEYGRDRLMDALDSEVPDVFRNTLEKKWKRLRIAARRSRGMASDDVLQSST
jgi:hypothetical protein